jgi:hypothetical protein
MRWGVNCVIGKTHPCGQGSTERERARTDKQEDKLYSLASNGVADQYLASACHCSLAAISH